MSLEKSSQVRRRMPTWKDRVAESRWTDRALWTGERAGILVVRVRRL